MINKTILKRIVFVLSVILVIIGGLFARKLFFEYFGFYKGDYTVLYESNSHCGFNGDGHYCIVLDCSDNNEKALKTIENWESLPLTDTLDNIVYGSFRYNGSNIADTAHIPQIKNGYYKFVDRFPKHIHNGNDSDFLKRGAYNFSIALYDSDTDMMYYFELDT